MTIKPVADLYSIVVPGGRSTTYSTDAAEASDCRAMGWAVQEYVKLERYQAAILQGGDDEIGSWNNNKNTPTSHACDEHIRYESNAGGNLWIQCSKQKYERMKAAGMLTRVLYERPQNQQQNIPENIPALREAVDTIRSCGISVEAEKIQSERDSLHSPVIPDGYALVPVEPTAEMLQSGIAAHYERSQIQIHDRPAPGPMECAYVAMIAAVPHFREIVNSSTKNFRENAETSTNCPCCGRKPLKHSKCSVPGCGRKHVAHGLCQRHYDMKRREDPEQVEKFREANRRFTAKKRANKAAPQQEVK